jgi:hypothetical protein
MKRKNLYHSFAAMPFLLFAKTVVNWVKFFSGNSFHVLKCKRFPNCINAVVVLCSIALVRFYNT